MRRLLLVLPLSACAPEPQDFARLYLDQWCATFDEQCGGTLPDACRDPGAPRPERPPKVDCTYRTEPARVCLLPAGWGCADGVVEPPGACANVWDCAD